MALPSIAAFGGKRGSFAIAPTDGSSDRERVESSGVDSEAESRRFGRNACTRSERERILSLRRKKKREKLGIKIKNRWRRNFQFRLDLSLSKVLAENLRIGKIDM